MVGSGAHLGSAFGPWHREFLRQFEYDLQQVSGNPHLTLPYWDWMTDGRGDPGCPFTTDLMGGFGNAGPDRRPGWSPRGRSPTRRPGRSTSASTDTRRTPQAHAGFPLPPTFRPCTTRHGGPWRGLPPGRPPWPGCTTGPRQRNPPQITRAAQCRRPPQVSGVPCTTASMLGRWAWELSPVPRRRGAHELSGGVGERPAFWLHHANVDRLWAIWQRKSPTAGYVPGTGAETRPQRARHHDPVRRPERLHAAAAGAPRRPSGPSGRGAVA